MQFISPPATFEPVDKFIRHVVWMSCHCTSRHLRFSSSLPWIMPTWWPCEFMRCEWQCYVFFCG